MITIIILAVILFFAIKYIKYFADKIHINYKNRQFRKTPRGRFLSQTDGRWGMLCMHYGSFDRIPKDILDKTYKWMQPIADKVGYTEYDYRKYVTDSKTE